MRAKFTYLKLGAVKSGACVMWAGGTGNKLNILSRNFLFKEWKSEMEEQQEQGLCFENIKVNEKKSSNDYLYGVELFHIFILRHIEA